MTTVERTHDLDASELRASLRGELIQPGDASYEEARKVYNGMIDRRPALIVRCADVADVIAAVNFARECNLLVSIRSGGHNAGGLGVCDDGLVIDLSRIRYTHVDPVARTVRVGGGCTLGGCGPRHARLWPGSSQRHHLDDRRGRPHAWRWHRLPDAQVWAGD